MSFLIPTLQSRTTLGNMDGEAVPISAKPEESSQVEEQSTFQATKNVREPTPSTQKRKRSGETFERDLLKIMEKNVNDSNGNDPDRMFLLSLLPSLKQVKPSDKLDVQIKLMQTLKCYTSAPGEKPLTQTFPLTNTTQSGTFTFVPSQFTTTS
uniref:BESS domain-containing protein n=1 Tax=Timema cristinae TaxID=61476 RepID=A0A7R9HF63_TIMCR|nr:unnamed protein product [Timema cristinae]